MLKRLLLAAAVLAATTVSARAQVPVCSAYGQSCAAPDTTCSATVESPTTTICSATVASSTSTTPSSLLTGLVHYWTLDEASGTRADSVGSATLSDNNTVGSASGINATAASFVAAQQESLSRTTGVTGAVVSGAQMTCSLWIKPTTTSGTFIIIAHDDPTNAAATRTWQIVQSNATVTVYAFDAAGNPISKNGTVSLVAGQWTHLIAYFDTDSKMKLVMNGGTPAETVTVTTFRAASPGIQIGVLGTSNYFGGLVDEVGIWSRVITSDERTTLYNSGAGKFYPSF